MPPLLGDMVDFIGLGSRSKAAISDDETSELEEIHAPAIRASRKTVIVEEESAEQSNDDEEVVKDEAVKDEANVKEEEEEEDDDGEGEFVVEAIKAHIDEQGVLKFHVKWEGYEKRSEMTWEPEENLRGSADEILDKYLKSVGGREQIMIKKGAKTPDVKPKKRARTSTAAATPDGKHNGKRARKAGNHPASSTPPASHSNAAFKPPSGSWEDDVQAIDACEGMDGQVMVFLQWSSGHKTQHPLEQVYKRCPQKMLRFYEAHLSFTQVTDDTEPSADVNIVSSKRGPGRPRKTKKT